MKLSNLEKERGYVIDKLSNDKSYKLIEHKNNNYYFKCKWDDINEIFYIPIETRIRITKSMIKMENGIFCPKCDKLMNIICEGTEWSGGLFTFKSKYKIEECPVCKYKIKW